MKSYEIDALINTINRSFGKVVITRGIARKVAAPVQVPAARRATAAYQPRAFSILR